MKKKVEKKKSEKEKRVEKKKKVEKREKAKASVIAFENRTSFAHVAIDWVTAREQRETEFPSNEMVATPQCFRFSMLAFMAMCM